MRRILTVTDMRVSELRTLLEVNSEAKKEVYSFS